jgi:hypothetical protein
VINAKTFLLVHRSTLECPKSSSGHWVASFHVPINLRASFLLLDYSPSLLSLILKSNQYILFPLLIQEPLRCLSHHSASRHAASLRGRDYVLAKMIWGRLGRL